MTPQGGELHGDVGAFQFMPVAAMAAPTAFHRFGEIEHVA